MQPAPSSSRVAAIDLLRGVVMVLMVLDHARDFFADGAISPTDLSATSVPLFFTRWITHFCAPAFVLLAGTAIFLAGQRKPRGEHARFLLARGLFLVVLELTVVKFGWAPEPFYFFVLLQVIWAIGWSMVLMAGLSRLPSRLVGALGALAILTSPLWQNAGEGLDGAGGIALTLLTGHGAYHPADGHLVVVGYAIVPWLAVMMLGYGLGELVTLPRERFRRSTLALGLAFTAAFVALRAANVYGDPAPWSAQADPVFTVLSFLNTTKYPPSLAFLLMTLGPHLIALSLLDRVDASRAPWRWLLAFGRVPLFFYVAHLWLLRWASIVCALIVWGPSMSTMLPPPEGHTGNPEWPLFATYVAWAISVVVLYPPSRAFAEKKRTSRSWWLSYL